MYFATYQAIARDSAQPGLYREFPKDFFDLIIVDECHRGSARDESNWREILEYFEPAFQLGMTASGEPDRAPQPALNVPDFKIAFLFVADVHRRSYPVQWKYL